MMSYSSEWRSFGDSLLSIYNLDEAVSNFGVFMFFIMNAVRNLNFYARVSGLKDKRRDGKERKGLKESKTTVTK